MIATTRCKGGREQVREYLIEAREKAGLTQQDVANRIGISRQYYQMVETGERQKRMDLSLAGGLSVVLNIYKERPSLNCRPDEAARGLYIGAKLRDILRNQRKTGAFPRRGKGVQRENEGSVLMACRKQDRRERGPVLFLCIVPFSCLWFKIQKIP